MNNSKKYKLKPGRHQFVPGSHAAHSNNNLSDAEAEWYLEKYPHIAPLFEVNTEDNKEDEVCRVSAAEMQNLKAPESLDNTSNIQPKSERSTQLIGVIKNKKSAKSKK